MCQVEFQIERQNISQVDIECKSICQVGRQIECQNICLIELPEYMPGRMPDRTSEYLSVRMSEYVGVKLSEYLD